MPSRTKRPSARGPRRAGRSISSGNHPSLKPRSEAEHRRELCAVGSWIHSRKLTAGTDGNLSVRLDAQRILISPSATCKRLMSPVDLIITDPDGRLLSGRSRPSSEIGMHLLIYRLRPDVHAVCHAHPPTATGFAAAGLALNKALVSELVVTLGSIPLAPYGTPGTPELARALEPLVPRYDAILMANHGVVTYGPDLLTAYFRMETVEHFAQVSLVTELLGKQALLSAGEVEKLFAARTGYGVISASRASPDRPLSAESEAGGRVSVTREELEALIEEAVRKDRACR